MDSVHQDALNNALEHTVTKVIEDNKDMLSWDKLLFTVSNNKAKNITVSIIMYLTIVIFVISSYIAEPIIRLNIEDAEHKALRNTFVVKIFCGTVFTLYVISKIYYKYKQYGYNKSGNDVQCKYGSAEYRGNYVSR
jgi:hypothetical protein